MGLGKKVAVAALAMGIGIGGAGATQAGNLAQFGVPSIDGLKPFRSKPLDKDDRPGKETRLDLYRVGGKIVGLYRTDRCGTKPYAVLMDDGVPPVDITLVDEEGNGNYRAISPDTPFGPPDRCK